MKRIAVLVEKDYEDLELWYPYLRLQEAGFDVTVVGTEGRREYISKHGYPVQAQLSRFDAVGQEWDAVIIPGGWAPDKLRMYPEIVELVRKTNERQGVVAAICHGPSVLVSADVVRGRQVTSYQAIKDDLIHAGGNWVDKEVAVDGNLITSRTPEDLPAFARAILQALQ